MEDTAQENVEREEAPAPDQTPQNQAGDSKEEHWIIDSVPRYTSHAVGASMLYLPFGMARYGFLTFLLILAIEAFIAGFSMVFLKAMTRDMNDSNTNYFTIIEKHCPKIGPFVRMFFVIDVIVCTAAYLRTSTLTLESIFYEDYIGQGERTGHNIACFSVIVLFLVLCESNSLHFTSPQPANTNFITHNTNVKAGKIGKISVKERRCNENYSKDPSAVSEEHQDKEAEPAIDMDAVESEMHDYKRKRMRLLLCVSLVIASQLIIWIDFHFNDEFLKVVNTTAQCAGLRVSGLEPLQFLKKFDLGVETSLLTSIVLFSLMDYSIMLPACLKVLKKEEKNFLRIVSTSKALLFAIYTLFALLVTSFLGDSVPGLFLTAYGRNLIGVPYGLLVLAMTMVAMTLRVLACCKLIQVLMFKVQSGRLYLLITTGVFFTSIIIAHAVSHPLQLVVFCGAISCNLLMIIFPSISYLTFGRQETGAQEDVHWALKPVVLKPLASAGLTIQTFVMFTTIFFSFPLLDPDVGHGCRRLLNNYWA